MKRGFRKLEDGEWSTRSRRRKDGTFLHAIKCCDCGLVHLVQYAVTDSSLRFRAWREPKGNKK